MSHELNLCDMNYSKRERILKAGLGLSVISLVGSIVLLTQSPNGQYSRLAMTGIAIIGLLTGLSFFLQLRQKK